MKVKPFRAFDSMSVSLRMAESYAHSSSGILLTYGRFYTQHTKWHHVLVLFVVHWTPICGTLTSQEIYRTQFCRQAILHTFADLGCQLRHTYQYQTTTCKMHTYQNQTTNCKICNGSDALLTISQANTELPFSCLKQSG